MVGAEEFYTLGALEPRCASCDTILEYGENTTYDDQAKTHRCNDCGELVE